LAVPAFWYFQHTNEYTNDYALLELAARQISTNSSVTSEAPPTNPPSISGMLNKLAALWSFKLPP
jgi:hypothetical protein